MTAPRHTNTRSQPTSRLNQDYALTRPLWDAFRRANNRGFPLHVESLPDDIYLSCTIDATVAFCLKACGLLTREQEILLTSLIESKATAVGGRYFWEEKAWGPCCWTTSLSSYALKILGQPVPDSCVDWLAKVQNRDGGWGFTPGEESRPMYSFYTYLSCRERLGSNARMRAFKFLADASLDEEMSYFDRVISLGAVHRDAHNLDPIRYTALDRTRVHLSHEFGEFIRNDDGSVMEKGERLTSSGEHAIETLPWALVPILLKFGLKPQQMAVNRTVRVLADWLISGNWPSEFRTYASKTMPYGHVYAFAIFTLDSWLKHAKRGAGRRDHATLETLLSEPASSGKSSSRRPRSESASMPVVATSRKPKTGNDSRIVILHLSDLHFGEHSRFKAADVKRVAEDLCRTLKSRLRGLQLKDEPELITVTGDLTERGRRQEFDTAFNFLTALQNTFQIEPKRFVLFPGNHDVSWAASAAALEELPEKADDPASRREAIDQAKFKLYREFEAKFYGVPDLSILGRSFYRDARIRDFSDIRVSIATLNSCEKESHLPEDHVGLVSHSQADALMNLWQSEDYCNWIKIIALHHNPDSTVPETVEQWQRFLIDKGNVEAEVISKYVSDCFGFQGADYVRAIATDVGVQLVLHGHHHARTYRPWLGIRGCLTHVLSAGSLSLGTDKLPADHPNSIQLVVLDRKKNRIQAHMLDYDPQERPHGVLERGGFVLRPNHLYDRPLEVR